jgi:DNA-directed RNA polymerase subunit RPC12/RpoP
VKSLLSFSFKAWAILLSDDINEEHWESHVAEIFLKCPLCGSKLLEFDVEYGSMQDYIYCLECNAKWEIDWKGENFKIEYIILVETGDTEKYGLKGEKHSPEFWQQMASQTKETQPNAKEKEVIRETQIIIKIRCQYCGKLYDEALDVCPNCGAKR